MAPIDTPLPRARREHGSRAPLILGVDPGTAATGYGAITRRVDGVIDLIECGVIRTDSADHLAERMRVIYEEIVGLIRRHEPEVLSDENVYHGKNARSALVLGHTRGVILLAASLHEVPLAEYSPREIKKAVVGNGNATKDQVAYMVQQQLRLQAPPRPSDAADGVAAALCHCMGGAFQS